MGCLIAKLALQCSLKMEVNVLYPTSAGIIRLAPLIFRYNELTMTDVAKYYVLLYSYSDYPSGGGLSLCAGQVPPLSQLVARFETVEDHRDAEILDEIFDKFNSDETNPLATIEAQKLIRELSTHTSMSCGDVIEINRRYYVIDMQDFVLIKK